jgi:hypothetical protein
MGWLRDDWLFLWRALEPASAPPGSAGVFPRLVADLVWRLSTGMAGDAVGFMHAVMVMAWLALAGGLVRWHRTWGGDAAGALLAVGALVAHGALAEPRLWASAGNGVLAAAAGVWGAWLLLETGATRTRLVAGAMLLALAVLARADAVLLLVLLQADRRQRSRWGWAAVGAAGVGLLIWMVAVGGAWSLQPAAGGRLLRLLLVPWGPPLPALAAAILGVAGLAAAAFAILRLGTPRAVALAAAAAAVIVAGSLAGWTPAGRYVLMPAVALALVLGAVRGRWRLLVMAWLAVHLTGTWFGNGTWDLLHRSHRETGLYRAVQAAGDRVGDRLVVVDPPPMGWTDSAADLENVASAARRGAVAVMVRRADAAVPDGWPVLVWEDWEWRWRDVNPTPEP